IVVILLCAGLTRSMQYTALNTLGFADIPGSLRSSAATINSMLMQVSMVLAIAFSALLLNGSRFLAQRDAVAPPDFTVTFIAMGLLVAGASLVFVMLPRDAGAEVSRHENI